MIDVLSHGERLEHMQEYLLTHMFENVGIDPKTGCTGTQLTVSAEYCRKAWKKRIKRQSLSKSRFD